jgi:ketosteroid isomerase-like protein
MMEMQATACVMWRITGTDRSGKAVEVHHHAMEVMHRLDNGEWVSFIDHPWGADASWAIDQLPCTDRGSHDRT